MRGSAVGYGFAVVDARRIVADATGGWTQKPKDGNVRMSPQIALGWGSNQKVLSGIALLDLLEDRSRRSVEQQLETPFRTFVPARWLAAYFDQPFRESLSLVTLGGLLDHTSGLAAEPSSGGSHGTKIALALSQGSNAIAHAFDLKEYNNSNYTLLLYIIPALAFPQ